MNLVFFWLLAFALAASAGAQTPSMPMPIHYRNSAEFGWAAKKILATRTVDAMTDAHSWVFQGTGKLTFLPERPALRVDMQMFIDKPAPTRNRLSSVNLQLRGRGLARYNRISMWIRPECPGSRCFRSRSCCTTTARRKCPTSTTARARTT